MWRPGSWPTSRISSGPVAEIDWKEARRYLGLHRGGGTVDEVLEAGLRDCGRALMACARPRSVWRRFPLALGEGRVETAGLQVESLHLRRHLEGCTAVCLFAATLGPEVDRLLHRASVTDVSRAVMIQACAASLLEVYCDECCAAIAAQTAAEGLTLRPPVQPRLRGLPHLLPARPPACAGGPEAHRPHRHGDHDAHPYQIGHGSGGPLSGGRSLPARRLPCLRQGRLRLPSGVRAWPHPQSTAARP